MTRTEARMVAEELYKLMKKDMPKMVQSAVVEQSDEYLNTQEAADFLGMSLSYVKLHINEIPHTKIGRLNKFKKSSLAAYRSRL